MKDFTPSAQICQIAIEGYKKKAPQAIALMPQNSTQQQTEMSEFISETFYFVLKNYMHRASKGNETQMIVFNEKGFNPEFAEILMDKLVWVAEEDDEEFLALLQSELTAYMKQNPNAAQKALEYKLEADALIATYKPAIVRSLNAILRPPKP